MVCLETNGNCNVKNDAWKRRGFKNTNTNRNHKNISLLKLKLGGRSGASPVSGPSLLSHTFHQWPFCFQVNLVNFDRTFTFLSPSGDLGIGLV